MASTLNFTTKRGDTFKQTDFQIVINESPLDLTDGDVKIQLRKQPGGLVYLEPTITIFDPENGEFCIDEQIINIEACDYKYDIQVTTENGEVNTWVSGLFTITNDITR
jgi:hypothetical protein